MNFNAGLGGSAQGGMSLMVESRLRTAVGLPGMITGASDRLFKEKLVRFQQACIL